MKERILPLPYCPLTFRLDPELMRMVREYYGRENVTFREVTIFTMFPEWEKVERRRTRARYKRNASQRNPNWWRKAQVFHP